MRGAPLVYTTSQGTYVVFPGPNVGLLRGDPPAVSSPPGTVSGYMSAGTARGWRFSQPLESFPNPAAIPADEIETAADGDERGRAQCASPCPGVAPLFLGPFCRVDGGEANNARA
ncbi:MAG TPA: hypothetical protein VKU41_19815 [Polyangiaceae bacterium]|nr:hypothetical protein [Polyangiaceae bacterium]